jgi:tetratricopeptide (TPR) repeat protein
MEKREAIEVLEKIANEGYYQVIWEGYEWYKDQLLPALEFASQSPIIYSSLLAENWHSLGWTFYELDAPLKAIECYRKAIYYDNDHSESYRELANCMHKTGDYKGALVFVIKARSMDPDDDFAIEQQEEIENSFDQREASLYGKGDLIWECGELLADEKFEEVFTKLKGRRKTDYLMLRARCYSAQKENAKFLNTLRRIHAAGNFFDWSYQDWFYLNPYVYQIKEFWEVMLDLVPLMASESVFESYQTLFDKQQGHIANQIRREVVCRFHIHRIDRNAEEILALHEDYTEWKELKEVANELMPPGMGRSASQGY